MADDRPTANDGREREDSVEMRRVAGRVQAATLEKLGELVQRHPEAVTNVLRRWMANR